MPAETESVNHFVTELRNRAKKCELGQLEDSLICDRLICGIGDDNVRRRVLRETDVSQTTTIVACGASEATAAQMTQILKQSTKKSTNC